MSPQAHQERNDIKATAQAFATKHKLRVFPVLIQQGEDGKWNKLPLVTAWQRSASTDTDTFNGTWDRANGYGVLAEGLTVIDCDHKGAIQRFAAVVGEVDSLAVKTPRGLHVYFKGETRTAVKIEDGIDLRSSATGWAVGPGSCRPDGAAWEVHHDGGAIAELPQHVLTWITEARPPGSSSDFDRRQAVVGEGERNDWLYRYGSYLRGEGTATFEEMRDQLRVINEHRLAPPLPDEEVQAVARQAIEHEQGESVMDQDPDNLTTNEAMWDKRKEEQRSRYVDGATFLTETADRIECLWGDEDRALWAKGESTLITGPPGHGKSTLAQNLVLGLAGLCERVLDLPVHQLQGDEFVLYLAADRPAQIARSFKRMVAEEDLPALAQRLCVRRGPVDEDVAKDEKQYLKMIQQAEEARGGRCAVVIVDSLKDMATGLSDDAVGAAVNRARQRVLNTGREMLELHHQRKAQQGGGKPKTLSDVYGSTWIAAGAGSVVLVWADKDPTGADVDLIPVQVTNANLKELNMPVTINAVIERETGAIRSTETRDIKDLFTGPTAKVTVHQVKAYLNVSERTAKRRLSELEGIYAEKVDGEVTPNGRTPDHWTRATREVK